MFNKSGKFTIHPSTVIFLIILSLCGAGYEGLITLGCALIHELGHYFAARLCHIEPSKITIYPFGADMVLSNGLRSYKSDIFIALSGPIFNLILLLFGIFFSLGDFFCACNLGLALINLMPINGLDGGTVLRGFLSLFFSPRAAEGTLLAVTFLILILLYLFAVYFLFSGSGDPSLFVIVCALFCSTFLKNGYNKKTENKRG